MAGIKRHVNQSGQVLLLAVVMSVFLSTLIGLAISGLVLRESSSLRDFNNSRRSFTSLEVLEEDVLYRIKTAKNYGSTETMTINGATVTSTIVDDPITGLKNIDTVSTLANSVRKKRMALLKQDQSSFNYGVQVGVGGLRLRNTAKVIGNVYANGSILSDSKNIIQGDAVSAGFTGLIQNTRATSSAYAHNIMQSIIDKDAYYQTIFNTIVGRNQYPNSPDQPAKALPITDAMLDSWEEIAEEGGIINAPCPYRITSDTSLGPVKINCDLEVDKKDIVLTLTGMVWVKGNVKFEKESTIRVSPAIGSKSVVIIAHDPLDELNKGLIDLVNKSQYLGSGSPNSFVMLVSRNSSSENGGDKNAIEMKNDATGEVILYSNHGNIIVNNHTSLREATAYKIELRNDSQLNYKAGLASTLFETGPGGSWAIKLWKEVE